MCYTSSVCMCDLNPTNQYTSAKCHACTERTVLYDTLQQANSCMTMPSVHAFSVHCFSVLDVSYIFWAFSKAGQTLKTLCHHQYHGPVVHADMLASAIHTAVPNCGYMYTYVKVYVNIYMYMFIYMCKYMYTTPPHAFARVLLVFLATPPLVTPVLLFAAALFLTESRVDLDLLPPDLAAVSTSFCFLAAVLSEVCLMPATLVAAVLPEFPSFVPGPAF